MGTNEGSILTDTKASLGIAEDVTVFDPEITMHVNSVLGTLNQIGVGPVNGFEIETDEETWADLLEEDLRFSPVKTYVHLRVKLIFDPPQQSWVVSAIEKQIEELVTRISYMREDLLPAAVEEPEEGILDGGGV